MHYHVKLMFDLPVARLGLQQNCFLASWFFFFSFQVCFSSVVMMDVVNLGAAGKLNKDAATQILGQRAMAGSWDSTVLCLACLRSRKLD